MKSTIAMFCCSLLPLASCTTPPATAPRLDGEVDVLEAMVRNLENKVSTKDSASTPAPRPLGEIAAKATVSRFASLLSGRVRIAENELAGLRATAESLARMPTETILAQILNYGKDADGLRHAIKILHVMDETARANVMNGLRSPEIRTILDHLPTSGIGRTKSESPRNETTEKKSNRSSNSSGKQLGMDSRFMPKLIGDRASIGRFVIAGFGQSRWQTIQDTSTGVVYNYRKGSDGKMAWVPITPPLLPGPKKSIR